MTSKNTNEKDNNKIEVRKGQDRFHTAYNLVNDSHDKGISFNDILYAIGTPNDVFPKGLKIMLDTYVKDGIFTLKNGLYSPT